MSHLKKYIYFIKKKRADCKKPVEASCCVVWWCSSVNTIVLSKRGAQVNKMFNYIFLNTDEYLVITEQIIKM